jgi:hypothetical protein
VHPVIKEIKVVAYRVLTIRLHPFRSVSRLTALFVLAFVVVLIGQSCLGADSLSQLIDGSVEERLLCDESRVLSSDEFKLLRAGVVNLESTEADRHAALVVLMLHFRNGYRRTPRLLPDDSTNQVLASVAHNESDAPGIRGTSAGIVVAFNSNRTDLATKRIVDGIWDWLLTADAPTRTAFVKYLNWGYWDGTDDRYVERIRALYELPSNSKEDRLFILDCVVSAVIEHRTCDFIKATKIFTEIAGSEKCSREEVKLILGRVAFIHLSLEHENEVRRLLNDDSMKAKRNRP